MVLYLRPRRVRAIVGGMLLCVFAADAMGQQQSFLQFGGAYSGLDERRQQLVKNWVTRFNAVTGQNLEAGPFYDDMLSLSTKTTFDAVTHALMTTTLTDASGVSLGDALSLVERVDTVKGEVDGASGDRQFRMYARLTPNARDLLTRSREFKRDGDNTVFHKGYPLNYREQGGAPSIQISMALDGRQADIDVDYRSSSFPIALFNGHLTAANSDVRAGNNADRHNERWTGFRNWWRGFLGVRLERSPDTPARNSALVLPKTPRAGKKNIEVMVNDFLHAWLVEADVVAAMGYVSQRAYACLGQDDPDPAAFDRGMAPFQLMINLKAAHETLGAHDSLKGLTIGARLANPALKVVRQANQAQFVIYSVPDDVAAAFDCQSRLTPTVGEPAKRSYGHFFGSTFYVSGRQDTHVVLLWAKEDGYWKIVSWEVGIDDEDSLPPVAAEVKVVHVKADSGFVEAARSFLVTWLIRKDYDTALQYFSQSSYACYDLARNGDEPASASLDDAGQKLRARLELAGQRVGSPRSLESILSAAEPIHPAIRVMDHPYRRTFSLTSMPSAIGDAVECDARARGAVPPDPLPLEYGEAFGMTVRFRTQGGDAPVLRLLWRKEAGAWRIRAYAVELP